jgi:hypothetical protein
MDAVLAEVKVTDPTAGAASDEEPADGVTAQATQQKRRSKAKKLADGPINPIDAQDSAILMDVDQDHEPKRKSKNGTIEDAEHRKKKKRKHRSESKDASALDDVKPQKKKKSRRDTGQDAAIISEVSESTI